MRVAGPGARSVLAVAALGVSQLAGVAAAQDDVPPDGLTLEILFFEGGSCEGAPVSEVDGAQIHSACAAVRNGSGETVVMRPEIGISSTLTTGSTSVPDVGMVVLPEPLPLAPDASEHVHLRSAAGHPVPIPEGCDREVVRSTWSVSVSWPGEPEAVDPESFLLRAEGELAVVGFVPVCPEETTTTTTPAPPSTASTSTSAVPAVAAPRFTG